MRRRLIAIAALAVGALAAPTSAAAHYDPNRVIIGEFQNCQQVPACRNANIPPLRLDVMMYQGTLGGQNYWVRCLHMGGTIRFENWPSQGGWVPVCVGVDV